MLRERAFSCRAGLRLITNRIPELGLHQLREISALMHQVAEIPALDDAALLEDQDQVRIPNGRQAVGNDEGGAALFQVFESHLHLGFGGGVQSAGGLVQDQNGRVFEQHPGDRQALALTAAQIGAALTDAGLVSARLAQDEIVGVGLTRRLLHLGVAGIRLAHPQVVGDTAVEQQAFLENHPDLRSQRVERHIRDVDAVDADGAGLRVVHALKQAHGRAFTGAGLSDQGHGLTRLRREGDVVQGLAIGVITETDMIERDSAPDVFNWLGAGAIGDGRLRVQYFKKFPQTVDTHEQAVQETHHLVHARDEVRGESHESDDLAHRGLTPQIEPCAHGKDADDRDGRHRTLQHVYDGPPVEHRKLGRQQALNHFAHHPHLGRQPHEALHQHHVAEGIPGPLGKIGLIGLDLALRAERAPRDIGGEKRRSEDQNNHH